MTKPWYEEATELLATPDDEDCYIGNDFVEGCPTCAAYSRAPALLKAALEERAKLVELMLKAQTSDELIEAMQTLHADKRP